MALEAFKFRHTLSLHYKLMGFSCEAFDVWLPNPRHSCGACLYMG